MLRILLLADIFQKTFNPACHLSGTCIQFLNLDTIRGNFINCLVFSFSHLLNIMKDLGNRLCNAISQTERSSHQNTGCNKNRRTHRQNRQPDISCKLRLHLHKLGSFLINIILHLFLKKRCQDFRIIRHKFLTLLIILYVKKLIHPLLKIFQIICQILKRT